MANSGTLWKVASRSLLEFAQGQGNIAFDCIVVDVSARMGG